MTHDVIGAAIEVHKDKGPGLLEIAQRLKVKTAESRKGDWLRARRREMRANGIGRPVPVPFSGRPILMHRGKGDRHLDFTAYAANHRISGKEPVPVSAPFSL